MADNIIQKIIRLVLDPDSAKKTQADTDEVTSGIENSWKKMAERIAEYLGVAFITEKVIEFGKESVAAASEQELAWTQLKGTIDGTGASFDNLSEQIHATAEAMQDATTHNAEEFAGSLTRMITLTGDVNASLNNMGLIANVAAQFFKGDLEPATNLVAKAMNGNVLALQRMGIHAKNAQEALDILSQRSMGAAEREAQTFSGQLKQMDNLWDDLLKQIGTAIVSSDGATTSLTVLRAAFEQLTTFVSANQDTLAQWVTDGVKFAIDAADVFIRAVVGMANILTGGFQTSLGLASQGLSLFIRGLSQAADFGGVLDAMLGRTNAMVKDAQLATNLKAQADALDQWGAAAVALGSAKVQKGINVLSIPMFSSEQFANAPKRIAASVPGEENRPQVGSEGLLPKDVKKGLEDFEKAGRNITAMSDVLGQSFDVAAAEIDRVTKLLVLLNENGIDPSSLGLGYLNKELQLLTDVTSPTTKALNALYVTVGTDLVKATLDGASALDKLKIEQQDVQKALEEILKNPSDVGAAEAVATLTARLNDLHIAIVAASDIDAWNKAMVDLGNTFQLNVIKEFDGGITHLDRLKSDLAAIATAMGKVTTESGRQSAGFKALQKDYEATSDAIKQQTIIMQVQAQAADFLADAVGAALSGGIHAAAVQKAKQTGIEAVEWGVRALAYALFGDEAAAGAAAITAAEFAGVAAAWGVLAGATSGGGSAGSASASTASAPTSSVSSLASSRQTSSSAASSSVTPSPEVSIYLTGPGFDALNPAVQRVVWGASQQAAERFGPNSRVRIVPNGAS